MAATPQEKASWAMRARRALESKRWRKWNRCCEALSELSAYSAALPPPASHPASEVSLRSWLARQALNWAREDALGELQQLAQDKPELDETTVNNRRGQLWRKLARVSPGRASSLGPIRASNGELVTDPEGKARALNQCWGDVFG